MNQNRTVLARRRSPYRLARVGGGPGDPPPARLWCLSLVPSYEGFAVPAVQEDRRSAICTAQTFIAFSASPHCHCAAVSIVSLLLK
jgi:hypothetical protein